MAKVWHTAAVLLVCVGLQSVQFGIWAERVDSPNTWHSGRTSCAVFYMLYKYMSTE